jgi:hypothetical protein
MLWGWAYCRCYGGEGEIVHGQLEGEALTKNNLLKVIHKCKGFLELCRVKVEGDVFLHCRIPIFGSENWISVPELPHPKVRLRKGEMCSYTAASQYIRIRKLETCSYTVASQNWISVRTLPHPNIRIRNLRRAPTLSHPNHRIRKLDKCSNTAASQSSDEKRGDVLLHCCIQIIGDALLHCSIPIFGSENSRRAPTLSHPNHRIRKLDKCSYTAASQYSGQKTGDVLLHCRTQIFRSEKGNRAPTLSYPNNRIRKRISVPTLPHPIIRVR